MSAAAGLPLLFGPCGFWTMPDVTDKHEGFAVPSAKIKAGSYGEVGRRIGRRFQDRIRECFRARGRWVEGLESFMLEDPATRRNPFIEALSEDMPELLEELEGISQGSGVPFDKVFAACINPELSALKKTVTHEDDCTSVALCAGDKLWIAHNEDGSCACLDHMYLLDIEWPSGARAWCFSYPGYWPGNGPSLNSAGLAQTVNYIGSKKVRQGLPRYALDRAILEAPDMEAAQEIACHPRRAYSQHHYLLSKKEHRILSVETAADACSVKQVKGIDVHANHFVHPEMEVKKQFALYKAGSLPRYKTACKLAEKLGPAEDIEQENLLSILSNHENYPLCICRHPVPSVNGCTLGAVIIEGEKGQGRFFAGPPCKKKETEIHLTF